MKDFALDACRYIYKDKDFNGKESVGVRVHHMRWRKQNRDGRKSFSEWNGMLRYSMV